MSVLEARQIVEKFYIANPKAKTLCPEEIAKEIEAGVYITQEDSDTKTFLKFDYIKSNIRGYYFVIKCENCSARCRKGFIASISIDGQEVKKFLCGKCARYKYKRRTLRDKKALDLLLHPEKLLMADMNSMQTRDALLYFDVLLMREELEERVRGRVRELIKWKPKTHL